MALGMLQVKPIAKMHSVIVYIARTKTTTKRQMFHFRGMVFGGTDRYGLVSIVNDGICAAHCFVLGCWYRCLSSYVGCVEERL
jgi:hypothetical protein